jgi:hypothetical protein
MAPRTEKKIVFSAEKDGSTSIEAFGFADGTCLKATQSIEEALGKVSAREKKPEAFVAPTKVEQKIGSF